MSKDKITNRIFKGLVAIAAMSFLFVSFFAKNNLRADSKPVELFLTSETVDANVGDVVNVSLMADSFPNLISFGPIEIYYDSQLVEFMSFTPSTDLPEQVVITAENSSGTILLSGTDSDALDAATEYSASLTAIMNDENQDDAEIRIQELNENFVDYSFSSEETVCLGSFQFRIISMGEGTVKFWLGNALYFFDKYFQETTVSIGDGVSMNIIQEVSDNATLASLKIEEAAIVPAFSSDILEYSCTVVSDITEVSVTAITSNTGSTITITGDKDLIYGDNVILIDVTAGDNQTSLQYKIIVTRQAVAIPTDLRITDSLGIEYTIMPLPEELTIPDGFAPSAFTLGGYEIPCYRSDSFASVLLYLFDGNDNPGYYLYNPGTGTVVKYDSERTFAIPGRIFTVKSVPNTVTVPRGFASYRFTRDGKMYDGYINEEHVIICYLSDEYGATAFYVYDSNSDSFSLYKVESKLKERVYQVLAMLFAATTVIEAVMIIVIVLTIRRLRKEKINPRPNRV